MSESTWGANFALKRSRAQRNVESHIAQLLFAAAKHIANLAGVYRTGVKDLLTDKSFTNEANRVVEETEEKVEAYITAYAKASVKLLGVSGDSVDEFLVGKSFGKTFVERNRAYTATFATDIIKMVTAGVKLGYTQNQILSAVRTGYKEPFSSSVITKAQHKGIAIQTPSYGKGVYRSSYQNIVRNATATIALAWAKALEEYAEDEGFGYFRVHRGSSYPCDTCDYETTYIHKVGKDTMPPYHVGCVCYIEFVNKED